jgi:hypothetical protein
MIFVIEARLPSPHSHLPFVRSGASGVPLASVPWHTWREHLTVVDPIAQCDLVWCCSGDAGRRAVLCAPASGWMPSGDSTGRRASCGRSGRSRNGCRRGTVASNAPNSPMLVIRYIKRAVRGHREPRRPMHSLARLFDGARKAVRKHHIPSGRLSVRKWLKHHVVAGLWQRCLQFASPRHLLPGLPLRVDRNRTCSTTYGSTRRCGFP